MANFGGKTQLTRRFRTHFGQCDAIHIQNSSVYANSSKYLNLLSTDHLSPFIGLSFYVHLLGKRVSLALSVKMRRTYLQSALPIRMLILDLAHLKNFFVITSRSS